ncbi:MAG: PqqD family protein [Fusicatenibacter saccharivorans]
MRIRRQEGYLLQKIGNTHYLLPYGQKIADQQRGMELNETARILWEALETPKTMEELQQKMIRCYEVPEEEQEELKKDIQAFVKELLAFGAVRRELGFSGWNLRRRIEDRRNFHCCLWKRGLHSKTVCFF